MASSTDIAIMRMVTDITIAHLNTTKVETALLPRLVADLYRSFKEMEELGASKVAASAQLPATSVSTTKGATGQLHSPQPSTAVPATADAAEGTAQSAATVKSATSEPAERPNDPRLPELTGYRQPQTDQVPAVPIEQSVQWDYIVCLEDGKHLQMLKRYLRTRYQMSMEQYRAKWGLPHDYPATAPGYSARKSEMAKRMGLGKLPKGSRKRRAAE